MAKYFAGIGSRETPQSIQPYIQSIARYAEINGIWLRSGGADGADKMFEASIHDKHNSQIFLPWENFNDNPSPLHKNIFAMNLQSDIIAEKHHPNYSKLSYGGRLMMRRNTFQVLGWDLKSPSLFITCWTPNGDMTGGTSQALRIAKSYDIQIFNLGKGPAKVMEECMRFIDMC